MNVVICDDSLVICNEINKYLTENFELNTYMCATVEKLQKIIVKLKGNIQALIIDIVLKDDVNGIDIATKIHQKYPLINIIFLTGYDDMYYKQVFSNFQPFGFIAKPIQYNILHFFLRKIQIEYENDEKYIEITADYKDYKIFVNDIIYIQSRKRVCEIQTKSQIYKTYVKISDIRKKLTDKFVRCHQSYVVNLDFITQVSKNQLEMSNGDIIPISRKYQPYTYKYKKTGEVT